MSEKITIAEKLSKRKIKKPPAIIYQFLAYVWRLIFVPKLGVKFKYNININKYKGAYIVVSNHASRLDYIYTGIAFMPHRLNYVAGYNEFFRKHLAFIFRLLQVIPKKNFTPDVYAVKEISRVIKKGGHIMLFPEGMSSISGANQPCAIGSGKLLKHFKVPVLMTKISGGYLSSTKYCLDERDGRVEVTVDELFTPDDLERMSADEIQKRLDVVLYNDDYEWNKIAGVKYKNNGAIAANLHTLLYWCPKCESEMLMHSTGNVLVCKRCGNSALMDEKYHLTPCSDECEIPDTPRVWFDLERRRMAELVKDKNYKLSERVKLGVLPKYNYLTKQATSIIVGEGTLTISHDGLSYDGTREGKPFSFIMPTFLVPTYGMCTDTSRFYTFYEGEFLEFYPQRDSVGLWLHATEEMHRENGGAWHDFVDKAPAVMPVPKTKK